jgi:uncharacterized protein YecT (DUF1311 family)
MHRALIAAMFVATLPTCWAAEAIAERKVGSARMSAQDFSLDDSGCGGQGHLADVQCLGRYLQWLDREINAAYVKAVAKLPVQDSTDDRRGREQLRKSQRAWLQYKRENCTLIGGLEGGSNLAVAQEAAMCEEREIKSRIKFLRSIGE